MAKSTRTWFYQVTMTPTEKTRFWAKVEKTDGCWLWKGRPNRAGYGNFGLRGTTTSAHRASYLLTGATIPKGLVLDHLCRIKLCVNPDHLEPVTPKTNSRRSPLVYKEDACIHGHPRSKYSVVYGGIRYCAECLRQVSKKNQRRYRAKAGAVAFADRTHCGKGHELTTENVYVSPSKPNQRNCRICKRVSNNRAKAVARAKR